MLIRNGPTLGASVVRAFDPVSIENWLFLGMCRPDDDGQRRRNQMPETLDVDAGGLLHAPGLLHCASGRTIS